MDRDRQSQRREIDRDRQAQRREMDRDRQKRLCGINIVAKKVSRSRLNCGCVNICFTYLFIGFYVSFLECIFYRM